MQSRTTNVQSRMILERIYKRLLIESSVDVNNYGVATFDLSGLTTSVVYDINTVHEAIKQNAEPDAPSANPWEIIYPAIIGLVQIKNPSHECWDAKEIAGISGPGKIMYGVAYATSPSGLIISDRKSMTKQAISAWKGLSNKNSRERKPLDNPPPNNKTDEKIDDCDMREEDFLNYAYAEEGYERSMYETMKKNHQEFFKFLKEKRYDSNVKFSNFEEGLVTAGFKSFGSKYQESLQDK